MTCQKTELAIGVQLQVKGFYQNRGEWAIQGGGEAPREGGSLPYAAPDQG
jgi:hypothetical protein